MSIYSYEEAFGDYDKTTTAMRNAVQEWFSLYYGEGTADEDTCQRLGYMLVNKLVKTIFGEYATQASEPVIQQIVRRLEEHKKEAVQLALVGGECFIKPWVDEQGVSFTLVPRNNVLIFARNASGEPTDIGTVEQTVRGKYYYTLLERRSVDEQGHLTISNRLYRSLNAQTLGSTVALHSLPEYAGLAESYRYAKPVGSVGMVRMRTPMLNCVDGSADGVAVFAAATGLIRNIDRNEALMNGEFERGQSRIIASKDMLGSDGLQDHLFVGLDEDPEQVGITVFSPELREQSFLARKQEYLRNMESIIGLRRGMLSDANMEKRTATEITSSHGDFHLTVIEFQAMWETALRKVVALCCCLARLYGFDAPENEAVSVDWGNGVLYDEDKMWLEYKGMVDAGILKPEVALGWRFGMPTNTQEELAEIRKRYMPE